MYARVVTFEGADVSRIDELMNTVREAVRATGGIPGAKRIVSLVDRDTERIVGITLFDSEEAIRDAEPAFERMAEAIPEELRGRRGSVHAYEVVIDEFTDSAQAARLSVLEGAPENLDEGIEYIKGDILPMLKEIPGALGVLALVDRASGKSKTITFWDGFESLQASEAQAEELRSKAAEAMAESIKGVHRFEVALIESLVPAHA